MQSVTIIIPTYNRAKALAVVWQSYFGSPFVKRVVVVNDGSTDNTKEVLESLARHSPVPVKVIHHSRKQGQQISRRAGIAEADTEWVLFGEDDVWLGEDYVDALSREAAELGAKIIAGRIVNVTGVNANFDPSRLREVEEPHPVDDVFDMKRLAARFDARPARPLRAPFLHTIALIHRSVLAVVEFDTRYRGTAHREETDFYLSANDAGFPVYWTPATTCYHLRGPISITGGQRGSRLNWVRIEFWGFLNTWMFIRKHWHTLSTTYGFPKGPLTWFLLVYCRERMQLYAKRASRGRISGTWSNP